MKSQIKLLLLIIAVSIIGFTSCKKCDIPHNAKKVQGIGYLDTKDECGLASQGATYALNMTGDLQGCLFAYIDEHSCTDGNYLEKGRELFVGTYKGKSGSFKTVYDFQAKYEGCTDDGWYAGAELSGQCQHYIVEGSGTGDFKGVTGRIDFIDRVENDPIDYPYLGHLKF